MKETNYNIYSHMDIQYLIIYTNNNILRINYKLLFTMGKIRVKELYKINHESQIFQFSNLEE